MAGLRVGRFEAVLRHRPFMLRVGSSRYLGNRIDLRKFPIANGHAWDFEVANSPPRWAFHRFPKLWSTSRTHMVRWGQGQLLLFSGGHVVWNRRVHAEAS